MLFALGNHEHFCNAEITWRTYFSATRVPPRRLEDSETTLVAVMGYMMQIVSSVQNTTAHGNIFTLANWVWLVGLLVGG